MVPDEIESKKKNWFSTVEIFFRLATMISKRIRFSMIVLSLGNCDVGIIKLFQTQMIFIS